MRLFANYYFAIKPLVCLLVLMALLGCEQGTPPVSSVRHSAVGLYDATISRNGKFAAVASVNHGAGYWDLDKNELVFSWQHGNTDEDIVTTAISSDGSVVGTADRFTFSLWDSQTGESKGFWQTKAMIRDMTIANKGRHLAFALRGQLILYINMQTGRRLEISGHGEVVNAVSISANGRYLLSGGNDYRAIFWDLKAVKPIFIWEHENRVTEIAMSDNGDLAFSSGVRGDAYIWSLKTGKKQASLALKEREYSISEARFSPDSRYLLTGSAGRILALWDCQSGAKLDQWLVSKRDTGKPTGAIVYGLGFTEDKKYVLSEASSGFGEKWLIEKKLLQPKP